MGYDISNHAVDTELISARLIPSITQRVDVADLLDRGADLAAVAHRANEWGLRVVALDHKIADVQRERGPKTKMSRPKRTGFVDRLLGRQQYEEFEVPSLASGLPGFNSDLSVWGRPFFIVADAPDEALRVLDQYMACRGDRLDAVDAIARAAVQRLESLRGRLRPELHPDVVAMLDSYYPLLEHLPARDETDGFDIAAVRSHMAKQLALYQTAWHERDAETFSDSAELGDGAAGQEDDPEEPPSPGDVARAAPYFVLRIASQVLPGWMGRGYNWPSALLDKIGVKHKHLFETPTSLFEPLVREYPAIEDSFSTTIQDNYSLGGYVRPENIGALKDLLIKHRRDLILAWYDRKDVPEQDLHWYDADFQKVVEPVFLAHREGYGFIEAAEIYSGFMGAMN